jgi:glycerol transport system ATP-binding protein
VTVTRVQDVGTHLMLSATLAGQTLKARLSSDAAQLSVGAVVWLQVVSAHTCFYKNEEIVA